MSSSFYFSITYYDISRPEALIVIEDDILAIVDIKLLACKTCPITSGHKYVSLGAIVLASNTRLEAEALPPELTTLILNVTLTVDVLVAVNLSTIALTFNAVY
jgi:hypothetical protein